jgi:hypothetical protein
LRRFLDDQVWLENRRVSELLRGIESTALKLRQVRWIEFSTEMDASAPALALPMERPLYTPTAKTPLDIAGIEEAGDDLDTSVIFDQIVVDPQRLSTYVRHALQRRDQVGLVDVVTEHPIEHGLAEVVTYFSLDDPGFEVLFDESVAQHLAWVDPDGTASERWREDDEEHENFAGSAGKSGGQKEKLAYTILAASLAYQFKLDLGVATSKTFRFAMIDEAFGRGSEESTRFALELFRRLGMQLLIVTPLQKIHVIEPFVSAVGFVDNPSGHYSRLQAPTIEEFRQRRGVHDLARLIRVEA